MRPIGYLRSGSRMKFDAGHQPDASREEINYVDLEAGQNFELALHDLAGFDRVWLLAWFDRNSSWRPRVLPPRGPAVRRGLFATRSPHRPNPIGLTSVPLLSVEGRTLSIGPVDLLDGTPILDIKPYIPTVDSWPDARTGWLDEVEASENLPAPFQVAVSPLAQAQLDWLRDAWQIDFFPRAAQLLSRDPTPHRTRRILQLQDGQRRMACGGWRIYFQIAEDTVLVEHLGTGYTAEHLTSEGNERIVDLAAHLAFLARFPNL